MRKFNTAGPCDAARHDLIPPEARLPEARRLVDDQAYFVVPAPRLRALARAPSGRAVRRLRA